VFSSSSTLGEKRGLLLAVNIVELSDVVGSVFHNEAAVALGVNMSTCVARRQAWKRLPAAMRTRQPAAEAGIKLDEAEVRKILVAEAMIHLSSCLLQGEPCLYWVGNKWVTMEESRLTIDNDVCIRVELELLARTGISPNIRKNGNSSPSKWRGLGLLQGIIGCSLQGIHVKVAITVILGFRLWEQSTAGGGTLQALPGLPDHMCGGSDMW